MKKMGHSPGPWKICKEKPDSDGQINKGLAKANARLIAAAPQLLEAAKAALARFTEDKIEGYHLHHPVSLLEIAINNAEGRR